MTQDTGGPAFPTTAAGETTSGRTLNYEGMTLRDWFAGQALAGITSNHVDGKNAWLPEPAARSAYSVADAMIAARSGGDT